MKVSLSLPSLFVNTVSLLVVLLPPIEIGFLLCRTESPARKNLRIIIKRRLPYLGTNSLLITSHLHARRWESSAASKPLPIDGGAFAVPHRIGLRTYKNIKRRLRPSGHQLLLPITSGLHTRSWESSASGESLRRQSSLLSTSTDTSIALQPNPQSHKDTNSCASFPSAAETTTTGRSASATVAASATLTTARPLCACRVTQAPTALFKMLLSQRHSISSFRLRSQGPSLSVRP